MILRRLFWDLEEGTRAGLQPRANAGQTAPLGPSLRGLHWAGTASSTCVRHSGSKETTHMAVWDVLGLPVSLSSVLLWCGQLVQAYPALMSPPMGFCSSLIPGHCACPAGGQGGFGNLIGESPILWSRVFASFPFVVSIQISASTRKLILPFVSVITESLPPINTGTWQQFLETQTVVADIERIMPTTRHYFLETTAIIAWVSWMNTGPDTSAIQTQFLASARNLSIGSEIK